MSCGSCIRAGLVCTGYRNTEKLRIRDETSSVERKVVAMRRRTNDVDDRRKSLLMILRTVDSEPRYLPLALDVQAKKLFFDHYILAGQMNGSGAWDFLKPYYNSEDTPIYLKLTIDAASLAYLSHQFGSEGARLAALERYITALGIMSKVLQSPETSTKLTALFASLLLDLFEKLSTPQSLGNEAWSSHLRGALAISEKCGHQITTSSTAMRALTRLSTNLLISSLVAGIALPGSYLRLRDVLEKQLFVGVSKNPKWQLSNIMARYATLQSDIRKGKLAREDSLREARELASILKTFSDRDGNIKRTFESEPSRMIYGNDYSSYPDRHSTQTWNVVRLAHILVVDSLLSNSSTEMDRLGYALDVNDIASRICASVPQYVDCMGVVKLLGQIELLPPVIHWQSSCTSHTPSHKLACYTLIFPLYVAGSARGSDFKMWRWATEQLHYIGSHFGIRNAELVARILEERSERDPWRVYAMLGSYAFGA